MTKKAKNLLEKLALSPELLQRAQRVAENKANYWLDSYEYINMDRVHKFDRQAARFANGAYEKELINKIKAFKLKGKK